jgi:hypothetical protein
MMHETDESRRCDESRSDDDSARALDWSPDHRMLVEIRDTLYEGSWEDFLHDLRAKADRRPRVFDTTPDSPQMQETVADHLRLIEQIRNWEDRTGAPTGPDGPPANSDSGSQSDRHI